MSKQSAGATNGLRIGVGRKTINPAKGHSLAGYFNERPNKGVHDDLWVKALLIEQGGVTTGIISYDLILLSDPLIVRIRKALAAAGFAWGATVPLAATHTHTGPDVGGIFDLTGGWEIAGYFMPLYYTADALEEVMLRGRGFDAIGLDLGGTKFITAIIDGGGKTCSRQYCPTQRERGATKSSLKSRARWDTSSFPRNRRRWDCWKSGRSSRHARANAAERTAKHFFAAAMGS